MLHLLYVNVALIQNCFGSGRNILFYWWKWEWILRKRFLFEVQIFPFWPLASDRNCLSLCSFSTSGKRSSIQVLIESSHFLLLVPVAMLFPRFPGLLFCACFSCHLWATAWFVSHHHLHALRQRPDVFLRDVKQHVLWYAEQISKMFTNLGK